MRCTTWGATVAAGLCSVATPAAAAVPLIDGETGALRFGAYASNFSLFSRPGDVLGGLPSQGIASNAALLRLEWGASVGTGVAFIVHNRFFWLTSSAVAAEDGSGLGLGSTIPPERSLNLESELIDQVGASLTHDLDRLAMTIQSPIGDVTLGRQAITWGMGVIFTPTDIWSRFSPFELDTSQKRGVDAVRLLAYPADSELEVVLVDRGGLDRGSARDLSAGVRVGWSSGSQDYYLATAKNYEHLLMLAGSTVDFDIFTARVEAQVRTSTTSLRYDAPFVAVGLDYQETNGSAILEYYFNGPGTISAADYADELLHEPDPEVTRGDRYFIGKHYIGAVATYNPLVEVQLGATAIVNLLDPSAMLLPSLTYSFSPDVSGSLGAYVGVGSGPAISEQEPAGVELGSEFGYLGTTYYFQMSGVM